MIHFILASASPRRLELLRDMGIDPTVSPTNADETIEGTPEPSQYVMTLSQRKAHAYNSTLADDDILIAADTIVALGKEILGKPEDRDDAYRMICALSGNTHSVFTGVTIRSGRKTLTDYAETKVFFRELDKEDIARYVDSGEPMDKAGAYGIQGAASVFVDHIEGSFSNVVGLPTELIAQILKNEFDIVL